MKHLKPLTHPPAPASSAVAMILPLGIKLIGIIGIIDELILGQRESPWKAAF